jgi:hypothetical protein
MPPRLPGRSRRDTAWPLGGLAVIRPCPAFHNLISSSFISCLSKCEQLWSCCARYVGTLQHRQNPSHTILRRHPLNSRVVIPHHYTVETLKASAELCQICMSLWNHLPPSSAELLQTLGRGEDTTSNDRYNRYLTEVAIERSPVRWIVDPCSTDFVRASTTIPRLLKSYYWLWPIAGKLEYGQWIT